MLGTVDVSCKKEDSTVMEGETKEGCGTMTTCDDTTIVVCITVVVSGGGGTMLDIVDDDGRDCLNVKQSQPEAVKRWGRLELQGDNKAGAD